MDNLIAIVLIAVILGTAITYIIRAKKKGVTCIGCPSCGSCGHSHQGESDEEENHTCGTCTCHK